MVGVFRRSCIGVLLLLCVPRAWAAAPAGEVKAQAEVHPNPRLKLSYRRFAIRNVDGTSIWVDGAQLDTYPISRRWVRVGFELEAGAGEASIADGGFTCVYGLAGASAGFQYPMRVTPFVEGRFVGGLLGASIDRPLTVPGTSVTITSGSAVTWVYGGGIETGIEVYTFGRAYLSGSIGWLHTVWNGIDFPAILRNPAGGLRSIDLEGDSFTFKLGLGI